MTLTKKQLEKVKCIRLQPLYCVYIFHLFIFDYSKDVSLEGEITPQAILSPESPAGCE